MVEATSETLAAAHEEVKVGGRATAQSCFSSMGVSWTADGRWNRCDGGSRCTWGRPSRIG